MTEHNHSPTPGKNLINCFSSFRRHSVVQWLAARRCMVTTNLGTNAAIFLPFLISWTPEQFRKRSIMPCKRCETHKGVQAARIARSVWSVRHDLSSQRQHLRMAELGLSHRQPFDDQTYGNSTNTCPHNKVKAKQATALLQCQSSRPQCPSHERYLQKGMLVLTNQNPKPTTSKHFCCRDCSASERIALVLGTQIGLLVVLRPQNLDSKPLPNVQNSNRETQ